MASIPTDLITLIFLGGSSDVTVALNLFNMLKLIRVARLSNMITYLNLKSDIKMALKLAQLLFFLILYIH